MGRDASSVADHQPGEGIDRRTMIKRAAAGGLVAWTAPIILDSLASPAAALTCAGTCFEVRFFSDSTNCQGETSITPQQAGWNCPNTSTLCSTITAIGSGQPYSAVCITPPTGNCSTTNTVVFTQTPSCTWSAGGTCNANRQFLAARARKLLVTGAEVCVAASSIDPSGTTVTFTKATGEFWFGFQFLIGCACS